MITLGALRGEGLVIDSRVEALYKSHGFYIFQRCRVLLGDDEEAYDALHEVFVKLIDSRPRFDDERPILAWMNRVTTNHCFNRLRARRYRRHVALEEHIELADTTPLAFVTRLAEDQALVRRLLADVDERTSYVVVGYFLDENPIDKVAEELGISVPTVRRVLKRFLERSRKLLGVASRKGEEEGEVEA